jgi:hypothetical protein
MLQGSHCTFHRCCWAVTARFTSCKEPVSKVASTHLASMTAWRLPALRAPAPALQRAAAAARHSAAGRPPALSRGAAAAAL